jgi:hypothetical protein
MEIIEGNLLRPFILKPNDLRVGNWVSLEFVGAFKWDYYHFKEYVKGIRTGHHLEEDIISDKIEPIALTPEILEKCGFVSEKDKEYFHPTTMFFELRNVTALEYGFKIIAGFPIHSRNIFKGISTQINYLHQLQNLYFALTGEELTVNL